MSKVTIVAKLTAKSGCIEAVKAEVIKMLAPTREEQGCIEYRLHQDNADPAVFVFYENWKDQTAFEQHMESAHFKAYVAAVGDMITDKTVNRMTEIV
ncbi:antibiotic biosynthesis monooxygenase [Geomonas paludis]|uniref:Antibiotic biosynthesis monooxygenase n=1 Tax=Geomonas paludis TaxID=2740185 RepID=A0A6V8MWQ3_9BACT|nr:putative quinol monooxygenase [Geomonas paludis]UPU35020.1 antibiotic biosynthesis monooxygenase [Geomonas paludis]GFO64522.1 antibiotic biosynthesis monooxygenase [Geomonas paludis]